MQNNLPVLYFICAHNLLLITCFITSLIAVVLIKFSLCQNKMQGNTLPIFVVKEVKKSKNLVEPTGSASNKIFGSEQPWVALLNQQEWLKELEATSKSPIDLFHIGGQIRYSFVLMLISLTSLVMTSKFQKNICFKTRAVGLINIKTKECKSGRHL